MRGHFGHWKEVSLTLGCFWDSLGHFWGWAGCSWALLGSLRVLLGRSGVLLGRSWVLLECSWDLGVGLGCFGGALCCSGAVLGCSGLGSHLLCVRVLVLLWGYSGFFRLLFFAIACWWLLLFALCFSLLACMPFNAYCFCSFSLSVPPLGHV